MLRRLTSALVFLVFAAASAEALPIYAGYPPPGGATFSSSGATLGDSPGRTRIYGGFDDSMWEALYFNITSGTVSGSGASTLTLNTDIAAYSWSGNQIIWTLPGTWFVNTAFGTASTGVRLLTQFYEADGVTPLLVSDFMLAPMAGMPDVLLYITPSSLTSWGGGFQVRQLYQTTSGADLLGGFFDPLNTFGSTSLSTGAAFWYDPPAAVPEPTSLLLLGTGLVAGSRRLRRRQRTGVERVR